ncbi:MAG: hypothetical protein KDK41_14620 [Leptospiraceae bacterium]|nr:hypothetical protein [Leptospiraceae bacterium]
MKRIHIALSTRDIYASVKEYSARLGTEPVTVIPGEYALWRTDTINLSLRNDPAVPAGSLRHLGWEDPEADDFTAQKDVNGILWEHFAEHHQNQEILDIWPDAQIRTE